MTTGLMRSAVIGAAMMAALLTHSPVMRAADAVAGTAPGTDPTIGVAPVELRPAEGDLEDSDFPACATNCQRHLDASLVQCSGYRAAGANAARSAAPANCRETLGAIFQSCVNLCHDRYPGNRTRYR